MKSEIKESAADDETIVVCIAVSKMARPMPGSLQRQCDQCGAGIWVSPSTWRQIPDFPGQARLQCGDCAIPVIIRDPHAEFIPPSEETLSAVRNENERRERG